MKLDTIAKKLLLNIVFLICVFGCTTLSVSAQSNQETYTPCDFGGRVGKIRFTNESGYKINVKLWHPDTKELFATWSVKAGESATLSTDGKEINIGDDWGIQLGSSKVKCVGEAALWQSKFFKVTSTNFYE